MPNKSLITWTVQITKRFCISDGLVRKAQLLGMLYNKGFITALALALSGAGVVGGSIQAVVSVSSVEPSITGGDETGCQEREWDTESERMTRSPCGQVEPIFISVLPTLGKQLVCKWSWPSPQLAQQRGCGYGAAPGHLRAQVTMSTHSTAFGTLP